MVSVRRVSSSSWCLDRLHCFIATVLEPSFNYYGMNKNINSFSGTILMHRSFSIPFIIWADSFLKHIQKRRCRLPECAVIVQLISVFVFVTMTVQYNSSIFGFTEPMIHSAYRKAEPGLKLYDLNVMRQSACLVINPIAAGNFVALFNCTPMYRASDSLMPRPKAFHFSWLGPVLFRLLLGPLIFFFFRFPVVLFGRPGISICHATRCIYLFLIVASS